MPTPEFTGFPPAAPRFFRALARNNDKAWFAAHRDEYEAAVLAPARAFVVALGARLAKDVPGLVADPRTDRSIFRLHRDIRFSPDKSPFKTHLGLLWWEGMGDKLESSAFYFQLDGKDVYLGLGFYQFTPAALTAYRERVLDPKHGPALQRALRLMERRGYTVGGEQTQRVPRGFDPAHPRADLLKYKGLYAGLSLGLPAAVQGPELVGLVHGHFKAMLPLHRCLRVL
jgi:uncharacterized protein (TIGR02453 family)